MIFINHTFWRRKRVQKTAAYEIPAGRQIVIKTIESFGINGELYILQSGKFQRTFYNFTRQKRPIKYVKELCYIQVGGPRKISVIIKTKHAMPFAGGVLITGILSKRRTK